MGPLNGFTVEPLAKKHDRGRFSCGDAELDDYLKTKARKQNENDTTRVHVYANEGGVIAGFYTLSPLMLAVNSLPGPMQKGRPAMDVPATLLGKLASHIDFQRRGVGEFLLNHAIKNALEARKIVASAVLVIHAKATALEWYLKQPIEFEALPDDPRCLLLPLDF